MRTVIALEVLAALLVFSAALFDIVVLSNWKATLAEWPTQASYRGDRAILESMRRLVAVANAQDQRARNQATIHAQQKIDSELDLMREDIAAYEGSSDGQASVLFGLHSALLAFSSLLLLIIVIERLRELREADANAR